MGHVNNAVYSTYLEQARIGVLGGLSEFILARVEIDFRAELRAGEEVEIRSRCGRSARRASTSSTSSGPTAGSSRRRGASSSRTTTSGPSVEVPDAVKARLLAPAPAG